MKGIFNFDPVSDKVKSTGHVLSIALLIINLIIGVITFINGVVYKSVEQIITGAVYMTISIPSAYLLGIVMYTLGHIISQRDKENLILANIMSSLANIMSSLAHAQVIKAQEVANRNNEVRVSENGTWLSGQNIQVCQKCGYTNKTGYNRFCERCGVALEHGRRKQEDGNKEGESGKA